MADLQCKKCKKEPAQGFCEDCQKPVCAKCIEIHSLWEEFANHKIDSLPEESAEAININPPADKVSFCKEHPETSLKIFCTTCSELICIDCTKELHKDHDSKSVDDLFEQYKEEIISSLQPVKGNISKIKKALKWCDTDTKAIDCQRADVETDINGKIDELHCFLDEQKKGLLIN